MANPNELRIEAKAVPADIQFLEDQLYAFNVAQTGVEGETLAIFVRDDTGQIVAGIYGWTWGGCCEIRYLWVHQDWRGQGYGRRLLLSAEEEARHRGCTQIVLDTHSFQAPGFYEKFGYEVFGIVDEYPRQHQKIFLIKCLSL